MKMRSIIWYSLLVFALNDITPICCYMPPEPEKIGLMTLPKAVLYWFVADRLNTMSMNYGSYVAELAHTNGTVATTIKLDVRHMLMALWRDVLEKYTFLSETNNYLKPGTKDLEKIVALSSGKEATVAGVAFEAGGAFLTMKDWYISAMNGLQKWLMYENNVQGKNETSVDQSIFSVTTWEGMENAMISDLQVFYTGLVYFLIGFFVNSQCQNFGPALRAIITKNNDQLWAINTDPWSKMIAALLAYPMTVFAKPYMLSALSSASSAVGLEAGNAEASMLYDTAYSLGDKGYFAWLSVKTTIAALTMFMHGMWARMRAAHEHAN